jgi:hypothetical protein
MIVYKYVCVLPSLKALVATEMAARTAKHDLMSRWRNVKSTDDLDYKKQALSYFNLLFGTSTESSDYWNNILMGEIKGNALPIFFLCVEKFLLEESQTADDFQVEISKLLLYRRLVEISGVHIVLPFDSDESLLLLFSQNFPFQLENLLDIEPQVKHIHRISFEEGTALCKYAISKPCKKENSWKFLTSIKLKCLINYTSLRIANSATVSRLNQMTIALSITML